MRISKREDSEIGMVLIFVLFFYKKNSCFAFLLDCLVGIDLDFVVRIARVCCLREFTYGQLRISTSVSLKILAESTFTVGQWPPPPGFELI